MPREITHERRLEGADEELDAFLEVVRELGDGLGPLLIQLPPSLEFDSADAEQVWCIFDNTAAGEGTGDALALRELLDRG